MDMHDHSSAVLKIDRIVSSTFTRRPVCCSSSSTNIKYVMTKERLDLSTLLVYLIRHHPEVESDLYHTYSLLDGLLL